MAYIPPTSHITLLATLRRDRLLPVAGEVVFQVGQRVEANDIVAQAIIPDYHRIKDLVRDLGVPAEATGRYLVKEEGALVKRGEPIAVRKTLLGLAKRVSRSSVDGMLLVAGEGKALLAAISNPFELRAGVPGTIAKIIESRGVVVESVGALLEGIWGNGLDQFAVLHVVGDGPRVSLTAEQIEPSLRGAIAAVGTVPDAAIYKVLAATGIRGLILGSLKSDLLPLAQNSDFPVIVTDGFGTGGFSTPAFKLLAGNAGREVWLNAQNWNRLMGERPEVIIPLPSPGQAPPRPLDGEFLDVGRRVRVIRGAEAGRLGTVTAVGERAVALPSGVRTRAATVKLDEEGGGTTTVAFANLEILE